MAVSLARSLTLVSTFGLPSAPVTEVLLEGVRVVDLAGEPAAMAGRILADLGASVTRVGGPLPEPVRELAWSRGKRLVSADELPALLAEADVVLTTPGWPGTVEADFASAPQSVW